MSKIMLEIDTEQIERAMEMIPVEEQARLEKRLWTLQMERIVGKMRKSAKKNKITDREVRKICEEVRQELYEKKNQSGN